MLNRHRPRRATDAATRCTAALLVACAGCARSPLAAERERDLRDSVTHSVRRELVQAERHPEILVTERDFRPELLGIAPELMATLEAMAGPEAYERTALPLDRDLVGEESATAMVALDRVIKAAASNNLEVQFQRLAPAINEAQVVAADAAFDWVLFGQTDYSNLDDPRSTTNVFSPQADQRMQITTEFGIRRNLPSGGQFTIQQELDHVDLQTPVGGPPPGVEPSPENSARLALQYSQPLLRGFGSDVARSQVRLAINAEREEIATLKGRMIATVTETESAYWRLVQAQWDLLIFQRLLERGIETRDKTLARRDFDAGPAQRSNAIAEVEARRAFLISAQEAVRRASDNLKRLMNDPDVPVGAETLLVPVDQPVDAPIRFNLLDSYLAAERNRPEVEQAILSIDNTSIRQIVADNRRLPQLDLRLQARWSGLQDDFGESFSDLVDGQFVSYLAGLVFEQPIGNRGPEAEAKRARLERAQATIAYRNTVQNVITEVKTELRGVVTNYKLVEQTRIARLAATESLRSFQVEMELQRGFTVENLEIWFNRQTELAQTERAEIEALVLYNIALARLHASMGTALERNQIAFVVPDAPYQPR